MRARSLSVALLAAVAAGLAFAGCGPDSAGEPEPLRLAKLDSVSAEAWSQLARQRIFFGHQSVGHDIMAGVATVIAAHEQVVLEVRELNASEPLSRGVFAHGEVGRNFSYQSKLQAFADLMDAGLGEQVDIALLKFCYVDIMPGTDVRRVFGDYNKTMARLATRYPRTTFVHVSEPLTTNLTGTQAVLRQAKDRVKKLFGKSGYGRYFDNAPRNRFNRLLRARYGSHQPLFDLAAIESSNPDGSRVTYRQGGEMFFAMAPQYTNDGGHLNDIGRRRAAEQLLVFLAKLAVERRDASAGS